MHKEQIVGIAVRLFAIFLGIYTLRYVGGLVPYVSASPPNNAGVTYLFLLALVLAIAAVLMWLFPLTIANKIIPKIHTADDSKPLDAGGVEVVAFSIMGLWVLITAIPDIFYWATFVIRVKSSNVGNPELNPSDVGYIVSTTIELIVGCWLLLGSKGLLGVIRRARGAGA